MKIRKVQDGYVARVGDFFGPLAKTADEAAKGLMAQLEAYHPLDHVYIRCNDGTVLHLNQTPSQGWNIYIIGPEGYKGEGVGGRPTLAETKQRALKLAEERFGGLHDSHNSAGR